MPSIKQIINTKINNINAYLRDFCDEVLQNIDKNSLKLKWKNEEKEDEKETDIDEIQVLDIYLY